MKKKIFIWCSDISEDTGEGILANKFINDLKKYNKNYKFLTKKISNKKILYLRKIFGDVTDRIILPISGIICLWFLFLFKSNKKICYVNYLPLWNFLLFLFLPPGTILGPITGGSKFLKKSINNYLIRGFLFNVLYKISILILLIRQKKLLFSTDLLKNKFKVFKKSYFNYVFKDFKFKDKRLIRYYDLIFYLRKHKNKNTNLLIELAQNLSKNHKIITIGEKINNKKIKNLGKINKKNLSTILQRSKYSFISPENIYSLFALDCLSNGVHVFCNKGNITLKEIKKNMTPLDYNNFNFLLKNLKKKLNKSYRRQQKIKLKENNKFINYFKI